MDGRCAVCSQQFDEDEHIPRLIPSCGLSYCQKCIIEAQYDPNCCFQCPIDNQFHSLAYEVETLPINIALIKTLGDFKTVSFKQFNQVPAITIPSVKSLSSSQQTPLVYSSTVRSQKCQYHNKIKQFRCKDDNEYVCSHCILFGNHQNHQIQSINRGSSKINKQKINTLFQQVIRKMSELDINIKDFLQPPNSFVKNLDNLKRQLKYQVKRKFKSYHEIITEKQLQIQKQIQEVIEGCYMEMQGIQNQLNIQYSTICCIKQQINSVRNQISSNQQFSNYQLLSQKKIQDLVYKITSTSNQLIKMNEQIVEKCNLVQRSYKQKIDQKQFIKIKQMNVNLIDNDNSQNYGYGDDNLMENSQILQKSRGYGNKSRQQSFKENVGDSRTYIIKSSKPSMFAPAIKYPTQFDTLPQSSFIQPPQLQSTLPLSLKQVNKVNQFTLRSDESNLTKSYISSTPSPTKNLQRYKSAYIDTVPSNPSLMLSKPSESLMSLNRSRIQSVKDQQEKRQTGKGQMRKKITKILQSIQSQKGTTLQLISMQIKDYYINQIFNFIKKSNRKYGLIKLVKNQITDEGFNKILFQLRDYEYAHTLNLTSNCLTQESLEWISDFGMYNKALKNIYLKNNQISHIKTKDKKQQIMETGINLYY